MSVRHVHAWYPWRSEEGIESQTLVSHCVGAGKPNPDQLQEQVLSAAKSTLWPHLIDVFKTWLMTLFVLWNSETASMLEYGIWG